MSYSLADIWTSDLFMLTVDDMGNYGVPSRLVALLFPVLELILIII